MEEESVDAQLWTEKDNISAIASNDSEEGAREEDIIQSPQYGPYEFR